MSTMHDHLQKFPNARPSTLICLAKQDEMTAKLQRENMEEILRNQLDRSPRQWWNRVRWPAWVWRW
jgi:hypothetical protein